MHAQAPLAPTLFQYAREDMQAARFEQQLKAPDSPRWIKRLVSDARRWHHYAIRQRIRERFVS